MKKILAMALAALMLLSMLPVSALASEFDTTVSGDYFTVISEDKYALAPGATETELVINNAEGSDRKVVHYFEVDPKNENIEVLPGYYGIDKLDPDNLPLEGVADKTKFWKAEQLTKTVAYYESLGYNVVGAMNTALAYDSDAPYGYMVMNGVVLGTPEVHKGAQTYLAIDAEGNCELRSMSTPLDGSEVTAISANFGWLVKDGALTSTTVERTSSDASRSMIGIKADGTLVFCQVDGRNAPFSTGLSNYEMGEMMLSLGCVNAVNCDGGGSSTFVSKREGETANTMRSVPSDGSERATINSVILVSKAKATGEFDHAVLDADFDYYAPGSSASMKITGVDAAGSPAELPAEGIAWALSDESFGEVADGVFVSNGKKGDVKIQMIYGDKVVGEKLIHIVDPETFALLLDETVLPYGKTMTVEFACTYGADDWDVCVEGAYTLTLSDSAAATLNGNVLVAPADESIAGVDVTATYIPNPEITDVLKVTYGKGSEIIYDFEDGTTAGFVNFDDAKKYSQENGIANTLVGNNPLAGQFSEQVDSEVFVSKDIVRNGNYALAWSIDNTDAGFAGWTYNVIFNIGESIVLRDVANGKMATTLGMWLYIPEGATGLAFQSQLYTKSGDTLTHWQSHFTFKTNSGAVKNLNSCTEADIPESRWVYASIDLTAYDYVCTPVASLEGNNRTPSFIRTYIKPMTPAVHTFYIDDITLDYSSAVDDRILPTISDVSYSNADESVALNEGATITGDSFSFSAVVADNVKLNNASGKICVDGVALADVAVSGKYLTTTKNVTLAPGTHTVAFEIKDTMGNPRKVTRTFTVSGDAPIVLDGHNDSGAKPEYGSVYYVDVNVADITAIDKMEVSLLLQDANTWEPQGITVADGFEATYTLDQVESILSLTIERNGEAVDAAAKTLVSVPVRLWTWDAINHVTGLPVTPESQFATGYCPVVTVDCEAVKGLANDTDLFGGKISVETMINDIVNPWHYHDAELTELNKEATCVVAGYTGRTYCETCKSVVDWGTVVEAKGHEYVDGKCACGAEFKYTGLLEENGSWFYYIGGIKASDWQMIGTDWYYFDPETKIGAEGNLKLNDVTFHFEDGKLSSGVWVKTLYGKRYYYGPGYYNDRGSWRNIDGKDYYFFNGVALDNGYQMLYENQINLNWYYFNADGTCDKTQVVPDGFYTDRNGYAYAKDGKGLSGMYEIDGKYYYFNYKGYAQKNGTYAGRLFLDDYAAFTGILEKNGTLYFYQNGVTARPGLYAFENAYYNVTWGGVVRVGEYYAENTYCELPAGTYISGEDGKLVNGIFEKDGIKHLYANGRIAGEGLYELDGEYYLTNWKGQLLADGRYYVSKTFCDLPANRNYSFDAEGRMFNGVEEIGGKLYLYRNGTAATYGLYKVGEDYYFANWGGVVMTNSRFYVDTTFCDLPANRNYSFDAEGKMLHGVEEVNDKLYLYKNGTTVTYGLYKVGEDYYFANWGGVIMTDGRYYVDTTFCDLPANRNYSFDAEGKLLNGVEEVNGKLYLYKNGTTVTYGLYKVGEDYYFANWGGVIMTDGRYYVDTTFCDLPANCNYSFDAEGKMLNGVEEVGGKLYLYKNGTTVTYGMYEVNGEYYFSNWGGVLMTDGSYFVDTSFCDLAKNANYTFGADGKMLNGFVEKTDGIYYYINGNTPSPRIIYVDGHYYYVSWGGKLVTNMTCYVPADGVYSEIPMNYKFNELGQLIK